MTQLRQKDIERFYSKIAVSDGCWMWGGSIRSRAVHALPYGAFKVSGKTLLAHRVSYELFVGEIGAGLVIDHICRVPGCVNPKHLEAVTQGDNTRRTIAFSTRHHRNKTHCIAGHPLSGENVYLRPLPAGGQGRCCVACRRINRQLLKERTGR